MTATIAEATAELVGALAPDELVLVPLISADFFERPAVRRSIVSRLLRPAGRDVPAAMSKEAAQLLVQVVLLVLNGVATQVLVNQGSDRFGRIGAAWRRCRRRRGARRLAPQGPDTPLPELDAIAAARVGRLVVEVATDAGLPAETGQHLANRIAALLQRDLP